MTDLGRLLMVLGLVLLVLGAVIAFAGRMPRLPGDILIRRDTYIIYIPIATSLLLSIILIVVLTLVVRR